jgi:hypothetical protein
MSNGLSDKVVRITLDGSGVPIPDIETVEVKKDNQKVRWCADFEFRIEIDGYTDLTYTTNGTDCAYRCMSGTFGEIKKYKYDIVVVSTGVRNDPYVDIRP